MRQLVSFVAAVALSIAAAVVVCSGLLLLMMTEVRITSSAYYIFFFMACAAAALIRVVPALLKGGSAGRAGLALAALTGLGAFLVWRFDLLFGVLAIFLRNRAMF